MPTLFARRYLRKIDDVGNTEKVLGIVILLLVAAVVAVFVIQVATNRDYLFNVAEEAYVPATARPGGPQSEAPAVATVEPPNPFPDPGLENWRAPKEVDRFDADNLYLKIDGQAPAYLHYGAVGLTFGTYYHQSDSNRTVDVYWYDMGKPDNALAIYRAEQPPDAAPVAIGREGYQVGGAVFFCKGSSYVQVIASNLDEANARAALKIAERVAERIGR